MTNRDEALLQATKDAGCVNELCTYPLSPEAIISASGIDTWTSPPDFAPETKAFVSVLKHLEGSDAPTSTSVRDRLIRHLKMVGYSSPAKLVDSYLAVGNGHRDNPSLLTATLQQSPKTPKSGSELEVLRDRCREFAETQHILDDAAKTMHALQVAGEDHLIKLAYLVMTARVLDRATSLIVKGPSSVGKSYPVQMLLKLFPPSAYYALTGMSDRGLVYLNEPMSHRILIIYEATGCESEEHSYFLRSLLSEGRISYQTNEKAQDGTIKPRLVNLEGPTGLITTTTAVNLHPENETRALAITANDSPEQTKAIMKAQASEPSAWPDTSQWVAFQEWIGCAEHRVTIPFSDCLADLVPLAAVRLRRDFPTVLNLIRAHAILHQARRDRDREGRIIATLADYATVRELTSDIVGSQVEAAVPDTVRETVDAVGKATEATSGPVSIRELAVALKLDKGTVSRRVRVALRHDYLQNEETQRGRPFKLVLGDPLPPPVEILPVAGVVAHCCNTRATVYPADTRRDSGKCCSVASVTRGSESPAEGGAPDWMAGPEDVFRRKKEAGRKATKPESNGGIRRPIGFETSEAEQCWACRGTKRWRRGHAEPWVCVTCHPPAAKADLSQRPGTDPMLAGTVCEDKENAMPTLPGRDP